MLDRSIPLTITFPIFKYNICGGLTVLCKLDVLKEYVLLDLVKKHLRNFKKPTVVNP